MIGVLPQGFPLPVLPGRGPVEDIPLLLAAAVGISLVAIGDTISTSGGFAAPRRLRGGRQPGARRDRLGQPRGRPVLGLPGEHERLADGGGLPVRGQDPADRPRRGGARPRDARCSCRAWSRRCRSRCWPPSSSPRRSASSTSPSCAACSASARRSSRSPSPARLGVAFIGVLQGIVVAVVLSVVYIFKRAWAPVLRGPRQGSGRPRLARHPALSGRGAGPGAAHRPLVGAALLRQREPVPRPDPRAGRRPPPRRRSGSSSPPSRSPTSTRPPGRCSRTWTSS